MTGEGRRVLLSLSPTGGRPVGVEAPVDGVWNGGAGNGGSEGSAPFGVVAPFGDEARVSGVAGPRGVENPVVTSRGALRFFPRKREVGLPPTGPIERRVSDAEGPDTQRSLPASPDRRTSCSESIERLGLVGVTVSRSSVVLYCGFVNGCSGAAG